MSAGRFCIPLAWAASLSAIAAWGYSVMSRPSEASLRDVSGVAVHVADALVSPAGVTVPCRVENQTHRVAFSVVLTVEITTEDGRVLAANPLGNVLGLKPGESRAVQVPMPPVPEFPSSFLARARVNLVRWRD